MIDPREPDPFRFIRKLRKIAKSETGRILDRTGEQIGLKRKEFWIFRESDRSFRERISLQLGLELMFLDALEDTEVDKHEKE